MDMDEVHMMNEEAQTGAGCNCYISMNDNQNNKLFSFVNYELGKTTFKNQWNNKNEEQLRETIFVGQIRYHKQQKKKVLPPNCINNMYYKDLGICLKDNLCNKIKNPVNYSLRKVRYKVKK